MTEAVVARLADVTIRRNRRDLLSGIAWTVRAGQRWVVLGPNGAGKTTLVRILSTYLRASSGSVEILGCALRHTDVATLRLRIGYLSPSLATMFPSELTPRQIVDAAQVGAVLPWYVDPARMSREVTIAALERVGMADARDEPYATFSSGEQLRIQLARALVTEPRLLLLDEPMASLDIGGRETLVTTLTRIAGGPIGAIVVVLHRLEDIPPGFTHALLLREGRVTASGPIGNVLTDELLSSTFHTPLQVTRADGRFSAAGADPQ
ncbi:MAG: ATP-binding cassette domain-containing protein [Candidatus Limnocylindria bacterium]